MNQNTLQTGSATQANDFTVDRLTSFEAVEAIRSQWNALHDELIPGSIHADIDWYSEIVKAHAKDGQPHVLAFRSNTELVGLIAGYNHERTIPIKLGYLQLGSFKATAFSTNYQCILAKEINGLHEFMTDILYKELECSDINLIYVNALPVDGTFYKLLHKSRHTKTRLVYPPARHMMMNLGTTFEETMASRGPSVRSSLHRIINKNKRPGATPFFSMRCYTKPSEVATYLDEAEQVAKITYQRALGVGFSLTELHKTQVALAADKGIFRGNILYADKAPVAFQEDYLMDTHCFNPYVGYNPAYRQHKPGTLLMVKAWEELIKSTKARVYDFGYGEGLYKERFADVCICEGELMLAKRSAKNIIIFGLLAINLSIEENIKKVMHSLGIYEGIKKFWRRRKAVIE